MIKSLIIIVRITGLILWKTYSFIQNKDLNQLKNFFQIFTNTDFLFILLIQFHTFNMIVLRISSSKHQINSVHKCSEFLKIFYKEMKTLIDKVQNRSV